MKIRSILLVLSLLVTPLVAQEPRGTLSASGEASVSSQPSPSASVKTSGTESDVKVTQPATTSGNPLMSTLDEAQRTAWLQEAADQTNADIITLDQTVDNHSLLGRNLVVYGKVNGNLNVVKGSVYVLGTVNGNISVVNGDLVVLGAVNGAVNVVGGNLRVAGLVEKASVVGGKIQRLSGGTVRTSTEVASGTFSGAANDNSSESNKLNYSLKLTEKDIEAALRSIGLDEGFLKSIQSAADQINSTAFLTFGLFSLVFWLALAIIAEFLFPDLIARGADSLHQNSLQAFFAGFIFWIAFWCMALVSLVLCLVLIGIPLLGGLFLVFLAVKAFGLAMVYQLIGRIVSKRFEWTNGNAIQCVLIGAVALGLLEMVPLVGFWIGIVVGIFGAGAVMVLLGQRLTRGAQIAAAPVLPSGSTPTE